MEHTPNTEWVRPVVHFEIEAIDENVLIPFYKEMFNWDIGGGPIHRIPAGIGGPENGVAGHIRYSKRWNLVAQKLWIRIKFLVEH